MNFSFFYFDLEESFEYIFCKQIIFLKKSKAENGKLL